MNIFWRTLKSFSRKEKVFASIFLVIFVGSFYTLFLSNNRIVGEISTTKAYSEGVVGEIKHLNPTLTEYSEADTDICSLIFSGLVKYNATTGEFEEDIATHTLSEDKLTYTFTLKNDTYWHDGTEVTADDIYFTFAEVIQSEDFMNPVLKSNFEGVQIEQINSRTVTFILNTPNSFFFTGLTVGLLPHHILGEVPVSEMDTDDFNKNPVGTGPYTVSAPYETLPDGSTSVSLNVFKEFYGTVPQIENLRFVAYPSIDDLLANRSVWHGAARIRQSQLAGIEDFEKLVSYQYELPQYTALFLNTDSLKLDTNKERLGVSKAINKAEILESIDYKVQIDTPLLELNQDEWIHTANQEESQGAFFDSGWSLLEGETYRTDEYGERYILRLAIRDFTGVSEAQEETTSMTAYLIQQQLKEVGVEVVIETYDIDTLQEVIKNRDYDMLLYGQSLGYNLDTFSFWHSSQATESGLNLSNYQNAKADFYMESIRTTFDDTERQELLKSLAAIIEADVPAVFLYTPTYYYLVDTKITGVSLGELLRPKDRLSNIATWVLN